ncbi:uncharacterized protein LOC135105933 [Scylla paramamosain]|uniref:uncharacterized protein LOC135105933 n=1 Tax=Scylla paramamosain TaxID=85552 RepID=UPI0030831098
MRVFVPLPYAIHNCSVAFKWDNYSARSRHPRTLPSLILARALDITRQAQERRQGVPVFGKGVTFCRTFAPLPLAAIDTFEFWPLESAVLVWVGSAAEKGKELRAGNGDSFHHVMGLRGGNGKAARKWAKAAQDREQRERRGASG